ncbi:uncharacterized protein LOC116986026 isoform X2 [Amblyraja radiata]|uniref:uncharacterized protein LOC116986026 isoform X2 n=1 Tax=Amblyraja radiata TaxID=386614 RepID=UPI00140253D0|nr:uncharacterized protein LOC116986026 isoform X2 [Amblyraja radiata]
MAVSSNHVIHAVAKHLKYYIDIQRKEDGFNLSGIDARHTHNPNCKPLPIVGIEKVHDRSLKHYFSDPNFKTILQMSYGRTIEKQKRKLQLNHKREINVQRMIRKKMSKLDFSNFGPQNAFNLERLKIEKRERVHLYPKVFHQVPPPRITRSEVVRLISSASKLIVATEIIPQNPYKKHSSKRTMKPDILKRSGKGPKWTEYEVSVCTGNCLRLGSKADICISFYGEKDQVKDIMLCNSFTNPIPFQNNQIDVFLLETQDVGKFKYIKIRYDGNEAGSGWYLKDIVIKKCLNAASVCVFHCNTWFASQACGNHSSQKFLPDLGADLGDGKSSRKGWESLTQKGQNGKSKQRIESARVVGKDARGPQTGSLRSTKRPPDKGTYQTPVPIHSSTSSTDNSDQRPSFSIVQTPLQCETPISGAQLEFCSPQVQKYSSERQPASGTPLKKKDIVKEVIGGENGSQINGDVHERISYICLDETKVTEKTAEFPCTVKPLTNRTEECSGEDRYYCTDIDQLLPKGFMEDVVPSDMFGSKSEKEWSDRDKSPKCLSEAPHFVHDIECKPQAEAAPDPPQNIAAAADNHKDDVDNNSAKMTWDSTDGKATNVENWGKSHLQEGTVATEVTKGLMSSATNNHKSLHAVTGSDSNSRRGVEEQDHIGVLKHADEAPVKEQARSEVANSASSLKEGKSATEPIEMEQQCATCDTNENKVMDEKTCYSAKQNGTNVDCIKIHDLNLCDVFENAVQTIKNGDEHKLENLCQRYCGLPAHTDDAGRSLLHIAAIYGNAEICQVLLQNCEVQKLLNSQDREGRTALHYGIVHNNRRMKRLLLCNGALPDIPDNYSQTALDLALNMINAGEIGSD